MVSSGCVNKILQKGDDSISVKSSETEIIAPGAEPATSGDISTQQLAATTETQMAISVTEVPVVTQNFSVKEVNPEPYVTQNPYPLQYRTHLNTSTDNFNRNVRIPQFTKSYVLRYNSTAVRVNVPKGPMIIDLTFNPQWKTPDQTSSEGPSSFVYSTAVVTVYSEDAGEIVGKDGYGGEFSSDLEKQIVIYGNGIFIVTLEGNTIDIKMAITTGEGLVVTPTATEAGYNEDLGDYGHVQ